LAAKAIPNDLSAADLLPLSLDLIKGLIARGLMVVSYSNDGTTTERNVQKLIIKSADFRYPYRIKHPVPGYDDLIITIAAINGQLIVMIQDSNHGLKTSRNNVFTGAKLLTLGSHIAMYQYARQAAFEAGSPLYHRDVEKTDRQDDNAAIRIHSGAHIGWLAKHHPELLGQLVYLFINGELIDAYQNRKIPHIERIKMVLRTKFFYEMWKAFLKKAGYAESRHFVSREFEDIIGILIDGLISLVVVYRDHMDGEVFPLMPWLHSSETCEHAFAECRKLIKDFTYLDFIYMIPRLLILIRAAVKLGHTGNSKSQASGYNHTYFDPEDMDIAVLSIFPTDSDIANAAREAWDEADGLWTTLGVSPADFMNNTTTGHLSTRLPSASSWFVPGRDPVLDHSKTATPTHSYQDDDGFTSAENSGTDTDDEETDAMRLQRLIDAEENVQFCSNETDERMLDLTCAAIAVQVDESMLA
jgi:hypothetical protein